MNPISPAIGPARVGGERTAVLGAGFFSEHRLCFSGPCAPSDGFETFGVLSNTNLSEPTSLPF